MLSETADSTVMSLGAAADPNVNDAEIENDDEVKVFKNEELECRFESLKEEKKSLTTEDETVSFILNAYRLVKQCYDNRSCLRICLPCCCLNRRLEQIPSHLIYLYSV